MRAVGLKVPDLAALIVAPLRLSSRSWFHVISAEDWQDVLAPLIAGHVLVEHLVRVVNCSGLDLVELVRFLEIPSMLASMGEQGDTDEQAADVMRRALQRYAEELTAIDGPPLTSDDLAARGLPTAEQCMSYETVEARRAAFASLTDALVEHRPEPEVLASLRTAAWLDVQAVAAAPAGGATATLERAGAKPTAYLDCEIVGVYW